MQICTFVEPQQGASYFDQLAFALNSERLGFHGFFRSDHLLSSSGTRPPGPSESWTILGGIARETARIRLGTLVTAATFRHPTILALQAATVDNMSNGRIELGLGAGWNRDEHERWGIPFPVSLFDRFEEQLALISGLWETPEGEPYNFAGKHYQITEAPALPSPTQQHIPIIIGGSGAKRTPELAARYADEYNYFPTDPAAQPPTQRFDTVRDAAVRVGRDPETLSFSLTISLGHGIPISELLAGVELAREAGAHRVYLQFLDMHALDYLDEVAEAVSADLGETAQYSKNGASDSDLIAPKETESR